MYKDPVIAKYFALIQAKNGAIKAYYEGEPIRVPASNLPCVIIAKRETRVAPSDNAQDEHGMMMTLTVITDTRKDLSTEADVERAVAGIGTLYDLIEGRNADLTLKDTSILNILRTNPLVDEATGLRTDLSSVTRVDYGETLSFRPPEEWNIQARVDFVASFHQVR